MPRNDRLNPARLLGHKGDRANRLRRRQTRIESKRLSPAAGIGNFGRLFEVAVRRAWRSPASRRSRHLRMQRFDRKIARGTAVSAPRPRPHRTAAGSASPPARTAHRERRCSGTRPVLDGGCASLPVKGLAALDRRLAPHVLLHALRRRNPRAARLAPARRAGNGLFHAQLIGQRRRVFERILPLRRHVGQALVHHLRRRPARHRSSGSRQAPRGASTPGRA